MQVSDNMTYAATSLPPLLSFSVNMQCINEGYKCNTKRKKKYLRDNKCPTSQHGAGGLIPLISIINALHFHTLPSTFPYSAISTSFKWLRALILLLVLPGRTDCLIKALLLGSAANFGTYCILDTCL